MTVPSSGRIARTVTTKLTGLVAAYLLVDITVHDRDSYISEYLPPVDSLIAKHGGKVTHRITPGSRRWRDRGNPSGCC